MVREVSEGRHEGLAMHVFIHDTAAVISTSVRSRETGLEIFISRKHCLALLVNLHVF